MLGFLKFMIPDGRCALFSEFYRSPFLTCAALHGHLSSSWALVQL